jgi:hypothetical protein
VSDEELKQLVESNASAIQAMLDQRVEDRLRDEERRSEDRRRDEEWKREHSKRMNELQNLMIETNRVQNGLARILGSLDENRPIILRRLMSIENKVDRLIEGNDK